VPESGSRRISTLGFSGTCPPRFRPACQMGVTVSVRCCEEVGACRSKSTPHSTVAVSFRCCSTRDAGAPTVLVTDNVAEFVRARQH